MKNILIRFTCWLLNLRDRIENRPIYMDRKKKWRVRMTTKNPDPAKWGG